MKEIKKCPFCNNEADLFTEPVPSSYSSDGYGSNSYTKKYVQCMSCFARGQSVILNYPKDKKLHKEYENKIEEEAIECWNKRNDNSKEQINAAYSERNKAVIILAKLALQFGLNAGKGKDDNEEWDDEWRNVVYVDLPDGQVSWHISPTELHLISDLPEYNGKWDGTFKKNDDNFIKCMTTIIKRYTCK